MIADPAPVCDYLSALVPLLGRTLWKVITNFFGDQFALFHFNITKVTDHLGISNTIISSSME
jgi:hypothetical protein